MITVVQEFYLPWLYGQVFPRIGANTVRLLYIKPSRSIHPFLITNYRSDSKTAFMSLKKKERETFWICFNQERHSILSLYFTAQIFFISCFICIFNFEVIYCWSQRDQAEVKAVTGTPTCRLIIIVRQLLSTHYGQNAWKATATGLYIHEV